MTKILNKRDSNTISMSKAMIAVIVTIALACIPALVAYGGLIQKVNALETECYDLESRQLAVNELLTSKVGLLEQIAAGNDATLHAIQEDITEIKLDVKELRKTSGGYE